MAGDNDDLVACHHRLTGPRRDPDTLPAGVHVITAGHTDRQTTLVVRTDTAFRDPSWTVGPLGLEDIVLFRLSLAACALVHRRRGPEPSSARVSPGFSRAQAFMERHPQPMQPVSSASRRSMVCRRSSRRCFQPREARYHS
ncbi:hypothetical protein ACWGB8_16480 [Kitasatospora sp. NPDC054939]